MQYLRRQFLSRAVLIVALSGLIVIGRALPSLAATEQSVTVFAAASLSGALSELAAAYQQRKNVRVRTVFAASSTLAKQILNGAPADIYISANLDWMDRVEQSGLVKAGSRRPILTNALSLIAPSAQAHQIDLAAPNSVLQALEGGRLAIGDPDHVPAGMYAKHALRTLGQWQSLKDHIAPAADVRAALAFVAQGAVNLGVVYASDTVGRARIVEVARFPRSSYPPIIYPMAIIDQHERPDVRLFFRFLQSDDAHAIFSRYGFSHPKSR